MQSDGKNESGPVEVESSTNKSPEEKEKVWNSLINVWRYNIIGGLRGNFRSYCCKDSIMHGYNVTENLKLFPMLAIKVVIVDSSFFMGFC